jgi:hypothetical protein
MESLCNKLKTFYNANILDEEEEFIKNEFLKVSRENVGNGKGRQTLMNLICNHFDSSKQKPDPEFIGGPRTLTVHWSNTYQKMIYIFGEYHSDIIDCDDIFDEAKGGEIDKPNAKKMSIEYFLGELIKTTDVFLDIFIEVPVLSNKETRKYHENFLPLGESRLSKLFDQFKECIEYPTRGGEKCKLARMHYFDPRSKEDDIGLSDGNDIIGYFKLEIQYFFNEATHSNLTFDELATKIRSRISKDKNFTIVLNSMCDSSLKNFTNFWISPLTKNYYINKELNRLEKDDPELKTKIVDYVSKEIIRRAMKERKFFKKVIKNIIVDNTCESYRFCKALELIHDALTNIYAGVVDAYILARVFKKFNMNEMKEKAYPDVTDQPDRARNIIIYGGDNHSELCRQFLKDILDFDDICSTGEREKDLDIVSKKDVFCIDMKTIDKPLFIYPTLKQQIYSVGKVNKPINSSLQKALDIKIAYNRIKKTNDKDKNILSKNIINKLLREKSVLVICQRKESVEEPDVQRSVIPTLEGLIEIFLKLKKDESADIKYMINGLHFPGDKADFIIYLDKSDPTGVKFAEEHKGVYDLVVLQTCPLYMMDVKLINDILKIGGQILCIAVSPGIIDNLKPTTQNTVDIINKFTVPKYGFVEIANDDFLIFQKTKDVDLDLMQE